MTELMLKIEDEYETIPPVESPVALYVEANPVSMLMDDKLRARFFAEIEREIAAHVPDLSTETGRKAIASLAYKVARTKTAIDAAGKKLNDDAQAAINSVNAQRRDVKKKLEEMQTRARKPLNEWEDEEEKRLDEVKRIMALLKSAPVITSTDTAATVADRIATVEAIQTDDETLTQMKATALEALRAGHARIVQDEADRAELAKLKAEKAERDRAAAEAEAKAKAAAQAEIDSLAAEARAMKEAEAARKADEARKAAEEEKRQSNQRHRAAVIAKARNTLVKALSLDEDTAERVVSAIGNGLIPNVTINF